MEQEPLTLVHKAFLGLVQRAEKNNYGASLFDTFVSTSPLIDHLSSVNSQIIYGRRGTGKTHALKYLEETVKNKPQECVIYIDFRSIGSNTSIYNDKGRSLSERASLLINDVLQNFSDSFTEIACGLIDQAVHPEQITIRLDDFQRSLGTIKILGTSEVSSTFERESKAGASITATLSCDVPAGLSASKSDSNTLKNANAVVQSGTEYLHIDFGSLRTALDGLLAVLGIQKAWILLDEWSEIPIGLQPYLADLIRRVILPSQKCMVNPQFRVHAISEDLGGLCA